MSDVVHMNPEDEENKSSLFSESIPKDLDPMGLLGDMKITKKQIDALLVAGEPGIIPPPLPVIPAEVTFLANRREIILSRSGVSPMREIPQEEINKWKERLDFYLSSPVRLVSIKPLGPSSSDSYTPVGYYNTVGTTTSSVDYKTVIESMEKIQEETKKIDDLLIDGLISLQRQGMVGWNVLVEIAKEAYGATWELPRLLSIMRREKKPDAHLYSAVERVVKRYQENDHAKDPQPTPISDSPRKDSQV
jgi:hypothetical protein